MKNTTLATIKSFIKNNVANLYVKTSSKFDGMTDGIEAVNDQYRKVAVVDMTKPNTFGIDGAWFVGQSRDYFSAYDKDGFVGFEINNSCGTFILAVPVKG
jgi:hypothetical protein